MAEWDSIGEVCLGHDPSGPVYGHDVLGDVPEWHVFSILFADPLRPPAELRQPGHVFEDVAPRLVDVTGDGFPEVIVVQSSFEKGARLAVFAADGGTLRMLAATPYIGTRNRWLAPVGAADLDGDGHVEIAYIDRPHLAKVLRIWGFDVQRGLYHKADLPGLTNHRIGWDHVPGGIRDCGDGPEMITADAGWSHVVATRFDGKRFSSRVLGPYRDGAAMRRAMACK